MAERNDTEDQHGQDPLEEAFNAPDAQDAPEAEAGVADAEQAEQSAADEAADPAEGEFIEDPASEAEKLANERLEDLRRLQAEFVNFRNRSAKEREQLREHVTGDLVGSLLPVLDDIDAARQHGDLAEGPFASIAAKLEESLRKQGVERFGEVGEGFDPKVHEAVMQQPTSEVEPDQISMVMRYGYRVNQRVIRPAQVAVAVAES